MSPEEVPAEDLPDSLQSKEEVPPEDMPSAPKPGDEVPAHDLPDEVLQQKHGSFGQQALTTLEGLGRGVSGGLSDPLAKGMRSVATSLGVSPENLHYVAPAQEDIAGRQEANPIESGGSELAGNVALFNALPQAGSKAIDGMIKMGALSGTNELSKAMLGQGDPTHAVAAHIAGSSALGLLTGGLFGKAEQLGAKGLSSIENAKAGNKLTSFLAGVGHAASFPPTAEAPTAEMALKQMANVPEDLHVPSFKFGQNFYNSMVGKAATHSIRTIANLASYRTGSLSHLAEAYFGGALAEKVLNKTIPKVAQKTIGPIMLKIASSGAAEDVGQAMNHATSCMQGAQKMSKGLESLFDATGNKAVETVTNEKEREKLREFIEGGGVDKQVQDQAQSGEPIQSYAEGGEVPLPPLTQSNTIAKLWPEQNVMINTAKGRISKYLNSVRPLPSVNKLPYDSEHKHPQKEQEYNHLLDMANQPLTILNKVKDGTLTAGQLTAFKSMHPELHQVLSQKMKEHIIKRHTDEEKKPSYAMRQSMSMFLGQNLESTLLPQNIQAAQSVFVTQKQNQEAVEAKQGQALSKMGKNYQTPNQAREKNLTKS